MDEIETKDFSVQVNRRDFLSFLGISAAYLSLSPEQVLAQKKNLPLMIKSLTPIREDKVTTITGINYEILIRWGDELGNGKKFGFNNDFIAYTPLDNPDHALLWVNHEYVHPLFVSGTDRSKENIDKEKLEVGGAIIEVKKKNKKYQFVKDSKFNRRLDADTKIPFAWNSEIAGSSFALGTMGNCAGGQTPWGTILTCEENYDIFWGEELRDGKKRPSSYGWEKFYQRSPHHYGWVVEINPKTGESKKLVSLGRCAHECAAVKIAKNGIPVVYTGDDTNDEHLYKFISNKKGSLEEGKLYVANLEKGEWRSLDINDSEILKKNFKNQTEIQVHLREAAKLIGATPLARPEDIEFDPLTGHVFIALTNNKPKKDFYGSILKIIENNDDPLSPTFKSEVFLTGNPDLGFACPDNMVFDKTGNLWFTTDIAGSEIKKGAYEKLGNNGLYVFLRSGPQAGQIIQLASAPHDAEFTGPCFSPDYKTLFLSVQHPGETSTSRENPTSHWPDGSIPKPAVIMLTGEQLEAITSGKL